MRRTGGSAQGVSPGMAAEADTPEGDRLDVLVTLVEAYERRHYPVDFPDPVEAIKFRMEQQGLTVDDLVPVIGRKNRVYDSLIKNASRDDGHAAQGWISTNATKRCVIRNNPITTVHQLTIHPVDLGPVLTILY